MKGSQVTEKASGNNIQIVILVLLVANLVMTGLLWLDRTNVSAPVNDTRATLPSFATPAELSRLASEIQDYYNTRNITGLYNLFDDVAKVQITEAQLDEQLGSFNEVLGKIESYAYSHFDMLEYEGQPVYACLLYTSDAADE